MGQDGQTAEPERMVSQDGGQDGQMGEPGRMVSHDRGPGWAGRTAGEDG